MSRDLLTSREAIATYVMAQPDSTLVCQLVRAIESRANGQKVLVQFGDRFIADLVKSLLRDADIEFLDETEAKCLPSGSSMFPISVPTYLLPDGPGRIVFNGTWDRPLVVAQAVGEILASSSSPQRLALDSRWLFWAMSYRQWRDIANLRDFVSWSIHLSEVSNCDHLNLDDVLGEFSKNGQLERLFTVDVDPDLVYFPPCKGQEPVVRERLSTFALSMGIPQVYPLIDMVRINWEFYLPGALTEIAYHVRRTESMWRNDIYAGFPVDPKDTLPFLRNMEWWEKEIGEKQGDDLAELSQDNWGRVQAYCRNRWSGLPEKELAKLVKLTVKELRQWKLDKHLETEFGGKQDGYQLWLSAREELMPTKAQPAPADSSAASGPRKYRLKLKSDSREVTVDDQSYPQCPQRAFKALTYALEKRKKKPAARYFNRRDLCVHLGLDARESMYDVFKGTPFYGRKAEPRLIVTAKIHSGKHSKNEYHLDVDVERSEIRL